MGLEVGQYIADDTNRLPVGTICIYLGTTAPVGWLLCNGASYTFAAYPQLGAILETQFGGSGANFSVPDLRNRIPVSRGGDVTGSTMGATGGQNTVTLTAAQSGIPSHRHSVVDVYVTQTSVLEAGGEFSDYGQTETSRSLVARADVNATDAHENRMPYYGLSYIIKAF